MRVLSALFVALFFSPGRVLAEGDTNAAVAKLLGTKCGACHQTKKSGGLTDITNLHELVAKAYIVPGKPEESKLFKRVTSQDDRMPPEEDFSGKKLTGLSSDQIKLLRNWITGFSSEKQPEESEPSTNAELISAIAKDLLFIKQQGSDPKYVRYLVFDKGESPSPKERKIFAALAFNSLSSSKEATPIQSLVPSNRLLRVWLPSFGWTAELFDGAVPYWGRGLNEDLKNNTELRSLVNTVKTLSGANESFARGVPFLTNIICNNEKYIDVLGQVLVNKSLQSSVSRSRDGSRTGNAYDLLTQLGGTFDAGKWIVLKNSGVALDERAIVAVPLPGEPNRRWWQTFEYSSDRQFDLFNAVPDGSRSDGSEIIFALPNGFLGFLAQTQNGKGIGSDIYREGSFHMDRFGPADVVDSARLVPSVPDFLAKDNRPGHNEIVSNPVSCFGCHTKGFIPKDDQLRDYQKPFPTITQSLDFTLTKAEGQSLFASQNSRLKDAVAKATGLTGVELGNLERFCDANAGRWRRGSSGCRSCDDDN